VTDDRMTLIQPVATTENQSKKGRFVIDLWD